MKQLLSAVVGCQDDSALFTAIQHPGEGGTLEQPTSTRPYGKRAETLRFASKDKGPASVRRDVDLFHLAGDQLNE